MARDLLSILVLSLGILRISENLASPNPQFSFPYYHSIFYPYHQQLPAGPYYQKPPFGPYYPSGPPNSGGVLAVPNRNDTRVSGAFHVSSGLIPFMVGIEVPIDPVADGFVGNCGGTLITPKHVLTAAHCFNEKSRPIGMKVYINSLTKTPGGPPKTALVRVVNKVDVHEKYKLIPPGAKNQIPNEYDVAVLTLTEEVTTVKPVQLANCIQTTAAEDKSTGFVAGWGGTEISPGSDILLGTVLNIISNAKCGKTLKRTQICTQYVPGGRDVCGGDSGGPLLVGSKDKGFIQLGIVSYGPDCDPEKFLGPGVYARVSRFIDWINTKTGGLLLQ